MDALSIRSKNKLPQAGLAILLGLVLFVEMLAFTLSSVQQNRQSAIWRPLVAVTVSTILTLWVHYDSRARNISLGIDQAMYIFFAWPITFPYYAFRSRGFRSGGLLLLSFMGIYILALVAAFVFSVGISTVIAIFSAVS
jgi:hypothetical protein